MLSYTFSCINDEVYGGKGWKPDWLKDANAFQGAGVAHDVMEHRIEDDGGAECEFKALGAVFYVRIATGWFARRSVYQGPAYQHITADIISVLEHVQAGIQEIRIPPAIEDCDDEYAEEILATAAEEAVMEFKSMCERDEMKMRPCIESERILKWLRQGYLDAVERYKNIGPYTAVTMFDHIREEADIHLRRAEPDCGYSLVVTVSEETGAVNVETKEPYYDAED